MMTIERAVMLLVGSVVLLGLILSVVVSPWWQVLPAFVAVNMIQFVFTGFCPAAIILKKLGLKSAPLF